MTDRDDMMRHSGGGHAPQPAAVGMPLAEPPGAETELAYEAGVELKARSQWAYVRMRFVVRSGAISLKPGIIAR